MFELRGDTHMTSTLREERGEVVRQKWDFARRSKCSGRPIFIFFIKEYWICAMNRHPTEPNINILLTRNLPIDAGIRQ